MCLSSCTQRIGGHGQSCTTLRHFNNQTKVLAQQRRGKSSSSAISPKIVSNLASSAAPSSKRSVRKRAVRVAFDCSERVAKSERTCDCNAERMECARGNKNAMHCDKTQVTSALFSVALQANCLAQLANRFPTDVYQLHKYKLMSKQPVTCWPWIGHVDERGTCRRRRATPITERVRILANMVHCLIDHAQLANAHAQ